MRGKLFGSVSVKKDSLALYFTDTYGILILRQVEYNLSQKICKITCIKYVTYRFRMVLIYSWWCQMINRAAPELFS